MVYCFLADGFEELEAIGAIDMLKRADIEVICVGVTDKTVIGAHGIKIIADCIVSEITLEEGLEAIVLPGGMPGALNLENSPEVQKAIDFASEKDRFVCAICAAPQILGHKGLLKGKKAIAYPGFEKELHEAVISEEYVVTDGKIITAKGAGVATEFGLAIVAGLKGEAVAQKIRTSIQSK